MNRVMNRSGEVDEDFTGGVLLAQPDLLITIDHPRVLRCAGVTEPQTRDMVARQGRGARHCERSRGHVDAGTASCGPLIRTLAACLDTTA
jgi:hypothetical protein